MTADADEKWLKIEISIPTDLSDAVSNYLEEAGAQGVFSESLLPPGATEFPEPEAVEVIKAFFAVDAQNDPLVESVRGYLKSLEEIFPDAPKAAMAIEVITDPDWAEQWKKYFKPIRVCKNIVVKPTWERYTQASRDIVVEIDPGMAFGTGQHASTRMCMEAVEDVILKDRSIAQWKVLDVGCGTGILGITAAKMGAHDVLCVDNDPKATQIAAENALINQVNVHVLSADAQDMTEPRNLIIANLTSNLLLELHDHLTRLLMPEGYLIISGIIEQDMARIEERFCVAPLAKLQKLSEKEWVCYTLKKNPS